MKSLTQLAYELNICPSWINKAILRTGGKLGQSGKPVLYTIKEENKISLIRFYRLLSYSFQEIKEFLDINIIPEDLHIRKNKIKKILNKYE